MCTMGDDLWILCFTELFLWVTVSSGIWVHHNGPYLSGRKPEPSAASKPQSTEDSRTDISACGGSDHRRALSDGEVLPDEPPGRTEPW